jgi:hypothetical protein
MAEPARKLDYDAPEHQPSKRTEGALGKVVNLDEYRKKKQTATKPAAPRPEPKAEVPKRKPEKVTSLDDYRKKKQAEVKSAIADTNKGKLGPTPKQTLPQQAMALGAAQAHDRMTAKPVEEALPYGTDERVFLEQDTKSYALREQTEEQKEKRRQAAMMKRAKEFTTPGGKAEEAEALPPEAPIEGQPGRPGAPVSPRQQQMRIMGQLQQGKAQERMKFQQKLESAQNMKRRIQQQRKAAIKANKTIRRVIKLIQVAGIESILPIITLILQLNLETINKWVFKIEIPGIILVEQYPKLDATDVVTCIVDFLMVFAILIAFVQMAFFFVIAMIVWGGIIEIISSILEIFSGLF